ncbi:MAG: Rieske 2Fe-2S domain-containing protein [Acidimicrobiia bacterium]|nr:Rieske 2Fe-2S domain-containing protein [Acidimicrobiia bacterium]
MTTTTFILILLGAALFAGIGIIAVAMRRSDSEGAATKAEFDRKAVKVDRQRRERTAELVEGGSEGRSPVLVAAPAPFEDDAPRQEISSGDLGVTRRKFFNRAVGAVFGLFMLQFTLASLAFMWPKLKGGFGTPINAGKVDDLKAQVVQGASIDPLFFPSAQAWIVPFDMTKLPGSSFESVPFVVAGGESDGIGLMALWQRCVHLGCRVPSCIPSQGFECPCHGSKYNGHGEYALGPAPRNMDRFEVSVNDAGELIINTGNVVQTARAKEFTIAYPQGPFCV